ncbi:uncharacterized protein LOC141699556 [Apium graveolens]|uniref:uncharacterized protein LOC141699556 n=1 Tax=Apium graveolens TaxID=4045 RepID=UPI003D79F827
MKIFSVVKESKVTFLCVQETKRSSWNHSLVSKLGLGYDVEWVKLEPEGRTCDGGKVVNPRDIKKNLYEHFKNRLGFDNEKHVFILGNLELSRLSGYEKQLMVKEFYVEEVEFALQNTESTKAPSPNGINAGVLKKMWPTIKQDVMVFFEQFYPDGYIPKGLNASFIALIPIMVGAIKPSDFWLISLMNTSMKLLTKVFVNRLKPCIRKLVLDKQSPFIQGRQISGGILMANEVVALLKFKRRK